MDKVGHSEIKQAAPGHTLTKGVQLNGYKFEYLAPVSLLLRTWTFGAERAGSEQQEC